MDFGGHVMLPKLTRQELVPGPPRDLVTRATVGQNSLDPVITKIIAVIDGILREEYKYISGHNFENVLNYCSLCTAAPCGEGAAMHSLNNCNDEINDIYL